MTEYRSRCPAIRVGPVFALAPEGPQSLEEEWHDLLPLADEHLLEGRVVNRPLLVCRFCAQTATPAEWAAIQARRLEERLAYAKERAENERGRPLGPPKIVVPQVRNGPRPF